MSETHPTGRYRHRRIGGAVVLLATLGTGAIAFALSADNEPRSVIRDGGFESGAVSLSLPWVDPFPLVVGGWGARGTRTPAMLTKPGLVFAGERAVRVVSRPARPVTLLQDVPLGTRGFVLRLALFRESGTQALRLLSHWERAGLAEATTDLDIRFTADELRISSSAGTFSVEAPLSSRRWVLLEFVADPRSGLVSVSIDDRRVAAVPGVPATAPRTLMIGGVDGLAGRYRYDAVSLLRLADVELAALRRAAVATFDTPELPHLMKRLDTAAIALSRPAPDLAVPELRVARRILEAAGRAAQANDQIQVDSAARPQTSPAPSHDGVRLAAAVEAILELLAES